MSHKNIKAVIFDLDGTLLDTVESIAYASNKALVENGLKPLPVEDYKYYAGDGADTLIQRALVAAGDHEGTLFDKAFLTYQNFFEIDCTYKVKPFDGIVEVLQEFKQKGIKIGIVSNKPHNRVIDVVEKVLGMELFDQVIGQQDAYPKKPDPTTTLLLAESLGVKPEDCMYVGDTNVDMMTGNRAGMLTVGVLWGFREEKELREYGADVIVSEPIKLASLVG